MREIVGSFWLAVLVCCMGSGMCPTSLPGQEPDPVSVAIGAKVGWTAGYGGGATVILGGAIQRPRFLRLDAALELIPRERYTARAYWVGIGTGSGGHLYAGARLGRLEDRFGSGWLVEGHGGVQTDFGPWRFSAEPALMIGGAGQWRGPIGRLTVGVFRLFPIRGFSLTERIRDATDRR